MHPKFILLVYLILCLKNPQMPHLAYTLPQKHHQNPKVMGYFCGYGDG
ncbi:hypothetical protein [Moraxella lacunata]